MDQIKNIIITTVIEKMLITFVAVTVATTIIIVNLKIIMINLIYL